MSRSVSNAESESGCASATQRRKHIDVAKIKRLRTEPYQPTFCPTGRRLAELMRMPLLSGAAPSIKASRAASVRSLLLFSPRAGEPPRGAKSMLSARQALRTLTEAVVSAVAAYGTSIAPVLRVPRIAFHDSRRDALIAGHSSFGVAVDEVSQLALVRERF